jgi:transposase
MDDADRNKNLKRLPIRLMFQDEARFGRMSDPKRCWVPAPDRPLINQALVREYKYIFGAVCPKTGLHEFMIADNMKTENMSLFLAQVSKAHPKEFVIMVVDGASTHKSKALIIPDNVALILLPPYSPELNPEEQVWRRIRRDYVANHYFETLTEAMDYFAKGLAELKKNRKGMSSLTFFAWITKIFNQT